MRLFLFSIFALVMFVLPVKAEIDWRYANDNDIQEFLNNGGDVNKQDGKGKTIFMYHWKDINLLKKFVDSGADLNIRDNNGETVLWEAVREDKPKIVQFLLNNGARTDLRNNRGEKVIQNAFYRFDILKIMLDNGVISKRDKRDLMIKAQHMLTEHRYMSKEESMKIINLLKEHGVTIVERYKDGKTVLGQEMFEADVEGLRELINLGFDVNIQDKNGNTPLMASSSESLTDKIKLLLEHGADPNLSNNDGLVPLFVNFNKPDVIKLLIEYGAKVDVVEEDGDTILHRFVAMIRGFGKYNEVCPILREENPIKKEYEEVFELLIKKGAKVNASNKYGSKPTMSAVYCPFLLRKLIEHGADINYKTNNNGWSPLITAVARDQEKYAPYTPVESVKILLEAGADVNIRDKQGHTALDLVTNPEKKELLIQYGAK